MASRRQALFFTPSQCWSQEGQEQDSRAWRVSGAPRLLSHRRAALLEVWEEEKWNYRADRPTLIPKKAEAFVSLMGSCPLLAQS